MSDLDTLAPIIDRPYGGLHPWRDLSGLMAGGWQASAPDGHLPFWVRIKHGEVDVMAVLQVGASQNFTEVVPEALLPDRTRPLPAFQTGHGSTVVQITGTGVFRVDPAAGFTQSTGTMTIGFSYPRRKL